MTKPKFTAGEWLVDSMSANGDMLIEVARNKYTSTVAQVVFRGDEETKANAHLISATTAMYEALEKSIDPIRDAIGYYESIMDEPDIRKTALGRIETFRKIRDEIYAALAKARGE